ncbi:hypothetical protein LTR54_006772 [Friedmanniomyces endolithicus]|uniref:MIP18 family-like domain-containing protein n=1 Tax=Friedmanniomyces endolithicus TaxID=329885 RepID=A0AAN6F868_9PEZI|nr:hypothetical protein LTS00_009425 [Friedmanniomyces endolithicus]KAK0306943.1 hypothetical protein LTR82_016174 [Friedmanniomyces endolithicus]KAK1006249.1 hypothetical protein LTR54_006772 [Friedmanniomyces endolithicus]
MEADKDNANPTIINSSDLPSRRRSAPTAKRAGLFDALAPAYPSLVDASSSPEPSSSEASSSSDEETEEIDEQEVYDLISTISDPEHPLSLGSLGVVKLEDIAILPPTSPRSRISTVTVLVTPTTSACSLTTVIGLGVKVRLVNALPPRFRIDVRIKPGTSGTAGEVNKQLGDKERVAAAMENKSLLNVVNNMLATLDQGQGALVQQRSRGWIALLPGYHQGSSAQRDAQTSRLGALAECDQAPGQLGLHTRMV